MKKKIIWKVGIQVLICKKENKQGLNLPKDTKIIFDVWNISLNWSVEEIICWIHFKPIRYRSLSKYFCSAMVTNMKKCFQKQECTNIYNGGSLILVLNHEFHWHTFVSFSKKSIQYLIFLCDDICSWYSKYRTQSSK